MHNRELDDERSGSPDPVHLAMRERFPEYATAIALGRAAPAVPDLLEHLAACAACRAELDELIELAVSAYTGQIAAAPDYPPPDLSFLSAPAAPAPRRPWRIDELGRLVVEFSAALIDALAPPALAGAARGQFLFRYVQEPGSLGDLEVTIEVYAESATPGQGRVRVGVDIPSRDPLDQSGSRVVVYAGGSRWQGETDESGCADLLPIPLAAVSEMRVEITPQS